MRKGAVPHVHGRAKIEQATATRLRVVILNPRTIRDGQRRLDWGIANDTPKQSAAASIKK